MLLYALEHKGYKYMLIESKSFGYALIFYPIIGIFIVSGIGNFIGVLFLFAPYLLLIFLIVMVSYLVGGIGLIRTRHWASLVVLITASVEIALYITSASILYAFSSATMENEENKLLVMKWITSLVMPTVIAYFAVKLRRR